jgi:hypothetical protein
MRLPIVLAGLALAAQAAGGARPGPYPFGADE